MTTSSLPLCLALMLLLLGCCERLPRGAAQCTGATHDPALAAFKPAIDNFKGVIDELEKVDREERKDEYDDLLLDAINTALGHYYYYKVSISTTSTTTPQPAVPFSSKQCKP